MGYYVYIIKRAVDQSYYKGITEESLKRLERHNNGESKYSRTKMPWSWVHLEHMSSKKEALIREKVLKKYSHDQIERLIASSKNCLDILGGLVG